MGASLNLKEQQKYVKILSMALSFDLLLRCSGRLKLAGRTYGAIQTLPCLLRDVFRWCLQESLNPAAGCGVTIAGVVRSPKCPAAVAIKVCIVCSYE